MITITSKITNSTDQYVADAREIKSGYVVVETQEDLNNLPKTTLVEGTLAYVSNDRVSYRYSQGSWTAEASGGSGAVSDVRVDGKSVLQGGIADITDRASKNDLLDETKTREAEDNQLSERIDNLEQRGHYLAIWDCTTGKPTSDPKKMPYTYVAGDYYIVGRYDNSTTAANYKPDGFEYNGSMSKTVCESGVKVNDTYYYDGSSWVLLSSSGQATITFSSLAGDPHDNTKLGQELDSKLGIDDLTLNNVKLEAPVITHYNIGKITSASASNPVTLGNTGDTLRQVFTAMMQADEVEPTITNPSITTFTLSTAQSKYEYGSIITQLSYTIASNSGSYQYGPATGVSWTRFDIEGSASKSDAGTSGNIPIGNYVVGESGSLNFTVTGTHTEGVTANTNMGNPSKEGRHIEAGTKTKTASKSISVTDYPYIANGAEGVELSSLQFTKGDDAVLGTNGATVGYEDQKYLYIAKRKIESSQPSLQIQLKSPVSTYGDKFEPMGGGTDQCGSLTITQANGVSITYWVYRIKEISQATGSEIIRLTSDIR